MNGVVTKQGIRDTGKQIVRRILEVKEPKWVIRDPSKNKFWF